MPMGLFFSFLLRLLVKQIGQVVELTQFLFQCKNWCSFFLPFRFRCYTYLSTMSLVLVCVCFCVVFFFLLKNWVRFISKCQRKSKLSTITWNAFTFLIQVAEGLMLQKKGNVYSLRKKKIAKLLHLTREHLFLFFSFNISLDTLSAERTFKLNQFDINLKLDTSRPYHCH